MPTVSERRFLTIREAAQRLRVHEDTVRRRIANGDLRAIQLGGPRTAIRIDESQLDARLYGPHEFEES